MVWTDLGRVRGGRELLSELCESHSDQCEPGEEGLVAVLSAIVSIYLFWERRYGRSMNDIPHVITFYLSPFL